MTLAPPLSALLAWAWQRWEVEILHPKLKGGFGQGELSDRGAATVIPRVLWSYALLVLAGYRTWGLGPVPGTPLARWHIPRRWSLGRLWQAYRTDLWQRGEFQPVWAWGELTTWVATNRSVPPWPILPRDPHRLPPKSQT